MFFLPNLVNCSCLKRNVLGIYMHREELTTVSMAHKASSISEHTQNGMLQLNTDETTLQQRKLVKKKTTKTVSLKMFPENSIN